MNKLTAAANAAKKKLLLETLEKCDWNLTRTAIELGLGSPSNVARTMKDLGLSRELEKARKDGRVTRAWKGK